MNCPKCQKSDEVVSRPEGPYCLDCGEALPPVAGSEVQFERLVLRRWFNETKGELTVKSSDGSEIKLVLPADSLPKIVALMTDELAKAATLQASELRAAILGIQNDQTEP